MSPTLIALALLACGASAPPPVATPERTLGSFHLEDLTQGCSCSYERGPIEPERGWVAHGEVDQSTLVVRWLGEAVVLRADAPTPPDPDGTSMRRYRGMLTAGGEISALLRTQPEPTSDPEASPLQGSLTVLGPDATETTSVRGTCGC